MDVLFGLVTRSADGYAHGQRALVVTAVLTSLSALTVSVRLYARVGLLKLTGREDWTIVGAMILSLIYLGLVAAQLHYGMGKHSWLLPKHILHQQLKFLWAAIPIYNASLIFTKFSILLQYLRIFPGFRFRLTCRIAMGIVAAYGTWAFVSGFLNCVPVAKFWNQDLHGHCLSFEAVWFFNASINIATDVVLLLLPMPLLSKLQLPRMQKFALMGVFAIGALVVVMSILRLSSLREVGDTADTSYVNVSAAYWTAAECNVAIICACLPFLRPVISAIFPKMLSTNGYNYASTKRPAGFTTACSQRLASQLYQSQCKQEYDMYSINVKHGEGNSSHSSLGGIEVTTEMTVVKEAKQEDTASERQLVDEP
ncbi:hypothetical protein N7495_005321 [Penicillium taxi]|uniref:uncharacterized protein n=1 Tax=Penicillium taxi TaxID=168475 RepID=UPI00254595F1|nr:uncharacterized protein N7495_005321 [Penicillium taxi]KAJ5893630.1 hypothetical protein N7495_005321 [Penicillium taxi]